MCKSGSHVLDDAWKEAEELFESMYSMIVRLAAEMMKFDTSIEFEDLVQQSHLALREACLKYDRGHTGGDGRTRMKKETYAFWYLRKFFQKVVDTNRTIYDVYDRDGNYVDSFYGHEYSRSRKRFADQDCTFRSRPAFIDPQYFSDNRAGTDDEEFYCAVVFPAHFDEDEAQRLCLSLGRVKGTSNG